MLVFTITVVQMSFNYMHILSLVRSHTCNILNVLFSIYVLKGCFSGHTQNAGAHVCERVANTCLII